MHMLAVLSRLAWRNLWRNHRRTLIMLLAITLGTWAMIFMTALMRGMVSQMVSDGISALPGHVQVHQTDFRDDPNITNYIPIPDSEIEGTPDTQAPCGGCEALRDHHLIKTERTTMEFSNQILFGNLSVSEDQSSCPTASAPQKPVKILCLDARTFVDDE